MTDAAAVSSPRTALDAHYYSGGLRVRRLGEDPAPWVPSPPERFAGFRDEVPLDDRDQVVEIARLAIEGTRLWWIALYRRSTDDQLPDRGNHAGVGVWVGDGDIAEPGLLLGGLRQLTAKLVEGGIDQAIQSGRSFLADYLPGYLRPLARMPAQLDGWKRASGPMPVNALFATDAQGDGGELALIADQIDRMALLPGPSSDHSRAVILIRATGSQAGANLMPLKNDLAKELIARMPTAMAEVTQELDALRTRADQGDAVATAQRVELGTMRASAEVAKARIAELEEQVAASDVLRRLAAIDDSLKTVDRTTRGTEQAVMNLRREVVRPTKGTEPDWQSRPGPEPKADSLPAMQPTPKPSRPAKRSADKDQMPWGMSRDLIVIGAVVVGVLFVVLMLYLIIRRPSY